MRGVFRIIAARKGWLPAGSETFGAERWPSGRRRTPAKGVRVKSPSRVRIPSLPPDLLSVAVAGREGSPPPTLPHESDRDESDRGAPNAAARPLVLLRGC